MYVDWQNWVTSHLVDGLVIGDITQQFLFPNRVGYGYVTEQESGIGVPNILWALQNEYWPPCASHRVKLYVIARRFKNVPPSAFMKTGVDGVVIGMEQVGTNGIVIE